MSNVTLWRIRIFAPCTLRRCSDHLFHGRSHILFTTAQSASDIYIYIYIYIYNFMLLLETFSICWKNLQLTFIFLFHWPYITSEVPACLKYLVIFDFVWILLTQFIGIFVIIVRAKVHILWCKQYIFLNTSDFIRTWHYSTKVTSTIITSQHKKLVYRMWHHIFM
jgi:hypothetical protein